MARTIGLCCLQSPKWAPCASGSAQRIRHGCLVTSTEISFLLLCHKALGWRRWWGEILSHISNSQWSSCCFYGVFVFPSPLACGHCRPQDFSVFLTGFSFWDYQLNVDILWVCPMTLICSHFTCTLWTTSSIPIAPFAISIHDGSRIKSTSLGLFLWFHRYLRLKTFGLNSWCSHPWDCSFSWDPCLWNNDQDWWCSWYSRLSFKHWTRFTSFHLFKGLIQKEQLLLPFHTRGIQWFSALPHIQQLVMGKAGDECNYGNQSPYF